MKIVKKYIFLFLLMQYDSILAHTDLEDEQSVELGAGSALTIVSPSPRSKSPRPRIKINKLPVLPPAPAAVPNQVILANGALEIARSNSPAILRSVTSFSVSDDEESISVRTLTTAVSHSEKDLPGIITDVLDVKLDEQQSKNRANAFSFDDRSLAQIRAMAEPRESAGENLASKYREGNAENHLETTASDLTDEESINDKPFERGSPSDRKSQLWTIARQHNQQSSNINSSTGTKKYILAASLLACCGIIAVVVWYSVKNKNKNEADTNKQDDDHKNTNKLVVSDE